MTNLTASQNLIEIAIQKSMELSKIIQSDKKRSPRVITISRELGSGGRIIAEKLHESLGWPLYDKEILEVLASQCQKGSGYRSAMFEALDEKTQTGIQAFIASCLGQLDKHSYFSLLSKAIILIAQGDAIILGRGAHLFLPKALNVRVKASFATRERNLQQFEDYLPKAARTAIHGSDYQRQKFVEEIVHIVGDIQGKREVGFDFDLDINTDQINSNTASLIILESAKQYFEI